MGRRLFRVVLVAALLGAGALAEPPRVGGDHALRRTRQSAEDASSGAAFSGRDLLGTVLVDWNLYMKSRDVFDRLEDWADRHTGTVSLEFVPRTSTDGKAYTTVTPVVRVRPAGINAADQNKIRVMVVFGEHAREVLTVEVGLALLDALTDPARARAELGLTEEEADSLAAVLPHASFLILPMENVNGRKKVENNESCERKNGRGVDINRNYEVDWGVKEPDYNPSEEYPGTKPLSEPEAALTLSLVREFKPHAFVNIHSGMFAMFAPYDHLAVVPDDENARAQLQLLEQINSKVCDPGECLVGPGGKTVGYLAHGTATDHMWAKERVPFVSTWEIYGDFDAGFHECFRMFNPTTQAGKTREVNRWTKALLHLVTMLPDHPGIPAEVRAKIQSRAPAETPRSSTLPPAAEGPHPALSPVIVEQGSSLTLPLFFLASAGCLSLAGMALVYSKRRALPAKPQGHAANGEGREPRARRSNAQYKTVAAEEGGPDAV